MHLHYNLLQDTSCMHAWRPSMYTHSVTINLYLKDLGFYVHVGLGNHLLILSLHTFVRNIWTYHCKPLLHLDCDHIHWLHSCLWYSLADSCLHLYILLLTSELDLFPHQRMLFLLVHLYLWRISILIFVTHNN